MGYELLSDVRAVVLGGINKETGKKNPTELEGYFIRVETRPNRFNKDKPQMFYVLRTSKGLEGVYGKASLDREMSKAVIGKMTKIINTGEKVDLGKGNPMVVFQVYQDSSDTIEVDATLADASDEGQVYGDEELELDEEVADVVEPVRPKAPAKAATPPSADRQARMQAILSRNKSA